MVTSLLLTSTVASRIFCAFCNLSCCTSQSRSFHFLLHTRRSQNDLLKLKYRKAKAKEKQFPKSSALEECPNCSHCFTKTLEDSNTLETWKHSRYTRRTFCLSKGFFTVFRVFRWTFYYTSGFCFGMLRKDGQKYSKKARVFDEWHGDFSSKNCRLLFMSEIMSFKICENLSADAS